MFRVIKLTNAIGDIVYVNPDNICMLAPDEFENGCIKHSTMITFSEDLNVCVRENIEQIVTLANKK